MQWLIDLFTNESVGRTLLLYSLIISLGVLMGKIKIGGISLGVTLVLFVGILVGHFGFSVNPTVLGFIKEFGLILFVYSIGLQVGPGFFASFKEGGLKLNLLACGLILLNICVAIGLYYILGGKVSLPMMTGILSGAVTNTPGLGAAEEALRQINYNGDPIGLGYAVAYPMGVIGIIGTMIGLRYLGRIKLEQEEKKLAEKSVVETEKPERLTLKVTNRALNGKTIAECQQLTKREFVVSRMYTNEEFIIPSAETLIQTGDTMLIIASLADVRAIETIIGEPVEMEWKEDESKMVSRRIVITQNNINGRTLGSLRMRSVLGVNITRVNRSGIDLLATPNLVLQVGDRVMVVGPIEAIRKAEKLLGNTLKRLNEPHLITIFLGILIGIIVGSIPIYFPGMPMPAKLGLAGGPLIVSILIGRFGAQFKLVTYTAQSANLMLREMGICLFLASVGIASGGRFVETVLSANGLTWVLCGLAITVIPAVIIAVVGRLMKINYFALIGLVAGCTTNPPALAYAGSISQTDTPAVTYSTVYPLSMFLRIITAQIIILVLA
ncbi:MAG: putative transporter [Paludibacteraceae bacterium]|nr:putative transporter [Paludibacteraceae bacterium]